MTEEPTTGPPHLSPEIVDEDEPGSGPDAARQIHEPSKLIRIASMTRATLEEVRQAPLDDAGRRRLADIYRRTISELRETVSEDLATELETFFVPFSHEHASESELRIAQAQLVGWLEGLFHGIQASLFTQQAAAAAQLEEMRRRRAFEMPDDGQSQPGQYL